MDVWQGPEYVPATVVINPFVANAPFLNPLKN